MVQEKRESSFTNMLGKWPANNCLTSYYPAPGPKSTLMWLNNSISRQTSLYHPQRSSRLRQGKGVDLRETPAAAPRLFSPEAPGLQPESFSKA